MIGWKRQGGAIVGSLGLLGGGSAQVVVLGSRDNPKHARVIVPAPDGGEPRAESLGKVLDSVEPSHLIEALCMQERVFGSGVLPGSDLA